MQSVVIISGSGKLSESLLMNLPDEMPHSKAVRWSDDQFYENAVAAVHAGSGRELPDLIEFCRAESVPLIQVSSGITMHDVPGGFTFIEAPNLSPLMLKIMLMLKKCAPMFADYSVSITESHQNSKKTVAGTALEIASFFGLEADSIKSIRDSAEQMDYCGIKKEHLPLHAFHEIIVQEAGVSLQIRTCAEGHNSYVKGVAGIIKAASSLEKRYYHVLELAESGII